MSFICEHELVGDTNTTQHVWIFYNKFQIIIVWDTNFVKICNLSKILNNKDCALSMKPSYRENLAHTSQIWDVYERPLSNLDVFLWHIKEFKIFNENPSNHVNVPLWNAFIDLANTCTPFAKICRDVQTNVECWINKGMQKHPYIDECNVLTLVECSALVKCFARMGEVQHL
jgi:hypothetical protein